MAGAVHSFTYRMPGPLNATLIFDIPIKFIFCRIGRLSQENVASPPAHHDRDLFKGRSKVLSQYPRTLQHMLHCACGQFTLQIFSHCCDQRDNNI